MTRKYTTKDMLIPPEVFCEYIEPEPIYFQFGNIYEKLTGFLAQLYRGMIWMYGEEIAKVRFYNFGLFKAPEPVKEKRHPFPNRRRYRSNELI